MATRKASCSTKCPSGRTSVCFCAKVKRKSKSRAAPKAATKAPARRRRNTFPTCKGHKVYNVFGGKFFRRAGKYVRCS